MVYERRSRMRRDPTHVHRRPLLLIASGAALAAALTHAAEASAQYYRPGQVAPYAYTSPTPAASSPRDRVGVGLFPSMRVGPGWGSAAVTAPRLSTGVSGVNADFLGNLAVTFGRDRFAVVVSSGLGASFVTVKGTTPTEVSFTSVPVEGMLMWSPLARLSLQLGGGVGVGTIRAEARSMRPTESDALAWRVHGGATYLIVNYQSFALGLSLDVNHVSVSGSAAELSTTGIQLGFSLAFSGDALSPN